MRSDYLELLGDPREQTLFQIHTHIIAFERALEYFHQLYYDSDSNSEEEEYLGYRLRLMSEYLWACQQELERRTNEVIDKALSEITSM